MPDLYEVNARVGRWVLDDRVDVFAEVWNLAGFFRDQEGLVRGDASMTASAVRLTSTPIPAVALIGVGLRME